MPQPGRAVPVRQCFDENTFAGQERQLVTPVSAEQQD